MNASVLVHLVLGFTVSRDPGGTPIVWDPPVVTVSLQADGSDDIDDGSDLVVMREALGHWSAACSDFTWTEGPLTSSRAYDPTDGSNIVTFLEDEWPAFAFGAIGFAPEAIDTSSLPHRRVGVDVIINGFEHTWATDGDPTLPDIGGVVTHELGHALGLWHSSDTDATMYFGSKRGGTHARILGTDDLRGLCFLYPRDPFLCGADLDCPLYYGNGGRTVCDAGSCVAGAVGFGLDCSDAAECQSGVCIAARYTPGGNPGFCSQGCDVIAQDCPSGLCSETSGAPLCYPHRESCVLDDAECGGAPFECVWDLDLVQRCLRACAGDGECSAPGSVCHAGYCRTPGAVAAGVPCDNSTVCQSLRCGGSGPVCQPLPGADDGAPMGDPMTTDGGSAGGDPPADGGADGGDVRSGDATGDGDGAPGDPMSSGDGSGDVRVDGDGGDPLSGDPVPGDPVPGDPVPGDALVDDGQMGDAAVAGDGLVTGGGVRRLGGGGCHCGQSGGGLAGSLGLLFVVWHRRRRRRMSASASPSAATSADAGAAAQPPSSSSSQSASQLHSASHSLVRSHPQSFSN